MAILDLRTGKPIAAPTFTRRKVLTGLAGILATGTAPAAFIRSAIAARSALTSGGGWKNPYVTEGLIAMWDGEWNAGFGKHDASTSEWIDLIGGVVGTPISASGFQWKDKSLYEPNTSSYCVLPVSFGQRVIDTMVAGGFTIEVVFAQYPISANQGLFAVIGTTYPSQYFSIGLNNRYNNMHGVCTPEHSGNEFIYVGSNTTDPVRMAYTSNQYYGAIAPEGGIRIYDKLYLGNVTGRWYYQLERKQFVSDTATQCLLGRGGSDSWKTFTGEVFSARFYEKELTADELAANYAVDKVRFNLP